MLDGSQEEAEAQLQEAEEMQRLRWEGGIDIIWVEQGPVEDPKQSVTSGIADY